MTTRGSSALALRLSIARTARDGSALVPALQSVGEGRPQPEDVIAQIAAVLTEPWPVNCYVAAAEALVRARATDASEAVFLCITQDEVQPHSAPLIRALGKLGGCISLWVGARLMEAGPQEVRDAMIEFSHTGLLTDFPPHRIADARMRTNRTTIERDAPLTEDMDEAQANLARIEAAERGAASDAPPDPAGLADRLGNARNARDETGMRFALDEIKAGSAYPPEVSDEVRRIMASTDSPGLRNTAAIALADIGDPRAADWIRDLIKSPKVARNSGTLLYALQELKARISLSTVVHVAGNGSFEAVGEVLEFIERGDLLPYTANELDQAKAALGRLAEQEGMGAVRPAVAVLESLAELEGAPVPS